MQSMIFKCIPTTCSFVGQFSIAIGMKAMVALLKSSHHMLCVQLMV